MNCRRTASVVLSLAGAGLALGLPTATWAQYKVVDANGRVTYTDRPVPTAGAKIEPLRASGGPASEGSNLPFELRQVAERYPVILYTSDPCEPCAAGRNLLRQRGIPFNEKTVRSQADRLAFQNTEASGELPVLRIGVQQLKGYGEADWSSYLDAAGYPRQSRLPPGYKAAEASPLVAAPAATTARAPDAPPPADVPAALPRALETAPNGIRF